MNNPKFDSKTIEAAKKGDTKELIKNLSQEYKEKLHAILNDKKAIEDFLKTPQAAAILKAFGGKNGWFKWKACRCA